jgi:hypothetical protein
VGILFLCGFPGTQDRKAYPGGTGRVTKALFAAFNIRKFPESNGVIVVVVADP